MSETLLSDNVSISVYCQACSETIAQLPTLLTPTEFKKKYGDFCPYCGKEHNDVFTNNGKRKRQSQQLMFLEIIHICKSTHAPRERVNAIKAKFKEYNFNDKQSN